MEFMGAGRSGIGRRCDQTKQGNCGRCFAVQLPAGQQMSVEMFALYT